MLLRLTAVVALAAAAAGCGDDEQAFIASEPAPEAAGHGEISVEADCTAATFTLTGWPPGWEGRLAWGSSSPLGIELPDGSYSRVWDRPTGDDGDAIWTVEVWSADHSDSAERFGNIGYCAPTTFP